MSDGKCKSFANILREVLDEQTYILIEPAGKSYTDGFKTLYKDDEEEFHEECTPLIEREAVRTAYKILESFEIYGDFLNSIPLEDKKEIIDNMILPWIISYSANHIRKKTKDFMLIRNEAGKEIKKNIGVIEKFELMLLDKFAYLPVELAVNEDKYLEMSLSLEDDKGKRETLKSIQGLLQITNDLKTDLTNKSFALFPKHKYYYVEVETKRELTTILDIIIIKYNLKSHSPHKKQLVDTI